jgi:site-specific DNA-cytosine methylase
MPKKRPAAAAASTAVASDKRPAASSAKPDGADAGKNPKRSPAEVDLTCPAIDKMLGMLVDKIAGAQKQMILETMKCFGGELRVGSACTGSNLTQILLHKFFNLLGAGSVQVKEVYSCERDTNKRSFVAWVNQQCSGSGPSGSIPHVFVDIADISQQQAPCATHQSNCDVACGIWDGPFIVHIGFSCKNISKLFCLPPGMTREQYTHKIFAEHTGSTGTTYGSVVQFAAQKRPPMLLLENVPELIESNGGDNIAQLVLTFNRLGYAVSYKVLSADKFPVPQKRRRSFVICMDIEAAGVSQEDGLLITESMFQTVHSWAFAEPMKLEEFLLKPSDPYLKSQVNRLQKVQLDREAKGDATSLDVKWRGVLSDMMRKSGFAASSLELPTELAKSKMIQTLPERELQGLAYWIRADPEATSIDVQPSIQRINRAHGRLLNTITPGSTAVLIQEARMMLGLEALCIQGVPQSMCKSYAESGLCKVEPDLLFADLAGNAFPGPVVLLLIVSMLLGCTVQHLQTFGKIIGRPPAGLVADGIGSEDSGEDVLDGIVMDIFGD